MSNKNAIEILESLKELRQWRKDNFPAYESPVAYDLIIFLATQFAKGEVFTVKQLFSSLPHSYTAIRQHYKSLLNENLIECISDKSDGRIKYVSPTNKFIDLIDSYLNQVSNKFPPCRQF